MTHDETKRQEIIALEEMRYKLMETKFKMANVANEFRKDYIEFDSKVTVIIANLSSLINADRLNKGED